VNAPAMTVQRLGNLLEKVERPSRAAGLGSWVEVEDLASGRRMRYRLVGSHEASPAEGLLSIDSPVGAVLEGRRAGEVVVAATPRGERSLRVLSVS